MQLKDLLLEHSRQAGVPLRLEKGVCHLVINEKYAINLEEGDAENFFLYAQVLRLPEKGNETIYRTILQANLYGKGTQGMVLALDSHGTQVILFKELFNRHIDFVHYLDALQIFVSQLSFWTEELSKLTNAGGASQEDSPPQRGQTGQWIKL